MAQPNPTMQDALNAPQDANLHKKEGEHNPTLGELLHISPTGEEEGLKETVKEKVTGGRTEDREVVDTEEKKNFMEKMKDKLPGADKNKTDQETNTVDHPATKTEEGTEKRGFMEKIKDNLPGHHKDAETAV